MLEVRRWALNVRGFFLALRSQFQAYKPLFGPLAQLVRAFPGHGKGHWFESSRVYQPSPIGLRLGEPANIRGDGGLDSDPIQSHCTIRIRWLSSERARCPHK